MNDRKREVVSDSAIVKCGGSNKESNHPQIYLKINQAIGNPPSITCPYCDTNYILKNRV